MLFAFFENVLLDRNNLKAIFSSQSLFVYACEAQRFPILGFFFPYFPVYWCVPLYIQIPYFIRKRIQPFWRRIQALGLSLEKSCVNFCSAVRLNKPSILLLLLINCSFVYLSICLTILQAVGVSFQRVLACLAKGHF